MRGAHLPEIVLGNKVVIGLAYVAGYVLLDRISFVEPYASFGITPWNPNTGLSFALVLIFGLRMIPLLFVSAFMADLINRQIGVPWAVEAIWVALIGGGYSTALAYLKRSRTRFDPALSSMRDLVLLILVAAASAAFVASTYVGVAIAAGLLSIKDFAPATLRYWIGDAVGILALTPLALFVLTRRRILPPSIETALQFAAIAAALLAVFGLSQEREFQLFYVLFLPIVWMAVRNGTEGVSAGILITQFGLILGVGLFPDERKELAAFQALMLVLAVTGLVAGELVTERRRMEKSVAAAAGISCESGAIWKCWRASGCGRSRNQSTADGRRHLHPSRGRHDKLGQYRYRRGRGNSEESSRAGRSRRSGDQTSAGISTARSQQSCTRPLRAYRQGNHRIVQAGP